MRMLMLCGTALLMAGGAAAPVGAKGASQAAATCDARYYSDLVGRGVDEVRSIQGSDYRVLASGAARGVEKPKRMTITFDPASRQILSVDCG